MGLFRKFFYQKPPDGLLEISERVYVFDCCFTTDVLEDGDFKVCMGGIARKLQDHLPESSFMVFNFREGENQSLISNVLSDYDMTVMDYPRHYEGCPILTMEMIHHFLRSSESWLLLGQKNVLLMHYECGGWPVLAFMLSALLIYRKQYIGEQKTLDMMYKQAPRELLQLMSPLNPIPSQLRYLQYVSRRNLGSEWPPLDRSLTLDCIILRSIPNMDSEGGFRPIFRIYGQDPFTVGDRTPKVLFSTPKRSKVIRHYKQVDCELVKVDIHCGILGDVVLECITLENSHEHEEMVFRVMFNTSFIRSNILMLNRDEIDMLWDTKDQFPKDFRTEVLFSEMDTSGSLDTVELPDLKESDDLPVEAFAKVQEIFSQVDWLKSDLALNVLQQITGSNIFQEQSETLSALTTENVSVLPESPNEKIQEKQILKALENDIRNLTSLKSYSDTNSVRKNVEPQESHVGFHHLDQSNITPLQKLQTSPASPVSISNSVQESSVAVESLVSAISLEESTDKQATEVIERETTSSKPVLQRPAQYKTIPPCKIQTSSSSLSLYSNSLPGSPVHISKYHSTLSTVGITSLLHDHDTSDDKEETLLVITSSIIPASNKSKTNTIASISPSIPLIESTSVVSTTFSKASPSLLENSGPSLFSPPPCSSCSNLDSKMITSTPPVPQPSNQDLTNTCSVPPSLTKTKSTPPEPPPLPGSAPSNRGSTNVRNNPSVPPPPALPSKGLSKYGCNGNAPPVPGLPSNGLLCSKGRGLSRMNPKNQGQTKKALLKPYHWLKLTRAMNGSLWAETQKMDGILKAPEFDMSELESLFSANAPNSNFGPDGNSNRRVTGPKLEKVHLIEHRRAYNCEIMLTKVKIPLSDLMSSVLTLDDSALDIDQMENLIKFCPTKEEMEQLKGYSGDKANLGKCEQFFIELMKVPRVESKLRVFSFKMQFVSQISDLRHNLNVINSIAAEIRNSEKLKRIMQTILSLGNALNHGTARGSAVGFRLDSLLKLTDTRARNSKMTLMHYLCKVLADKLPKLLDFSKELVSLEASTKIQLKYLAEEMQAISKGLEKVVQELAASENDGIVSTKFCKNLKNFLGSAEAEVRSLASLYSGVGRNADALAHYFGEDPVRCPFEQVVSTLLNFVRTFSKAHQENCKLIELEKKKAQKEAAEHGKNLKPISPQKDSSRCSVPIIFTTANIK